MVTEYRGLEVRVSVEPDADRIISVNHGLGTRLGVDELLVRCFNRDGLPVGYLAAIDVDEDVVEVVTVPGSGVAIVEITPLAAGEGG
jgi:hypothetical protein